MDLALRYLSASPSHRDVERLPYVFPKQFARVADRLPFRSGKCEAEETSDASTRKSLFLSLPLRRRVSLTLPLGIRSVRQGRPSRLGSAQRAAANPGRRAQCILLRPFGCVVIFITTARVARVAHRDFDGRLLFLDHRVAAALDR